MALSQYISLERTLILKSSTKDEALEELASALGRFECRLDSGQALEAIVEREQSVSSRLTEKVALPHALLPSFDRQAVAVGYSRQGIAWNAPAGDPVNLIVMSLYGESFAGEHLHMLAELARTIRAPRFMQRMAGAESGEHIYELLCGAAEKKQRRPLEARKNGMLQKLFHHACSLVEETRASALMMLAEDDFAIDLIDRREQSIRVILVCEETGEKLPEVRRGAALAVPCHGMRRDDRVKLSVLFALSRELVDQGDTLVCLSGDPRTPGLNTLELIEVAQEFDILLSLRSALEAGGISHHVLDRTLQIATTLAREGREGHPVGALFVLGDYEHVRKHCHQLVINPFRGYPEDERNLIDPGLEETIKEFSRIDGAFLIRGDGVIMSMGSYIHTEEASQAQEPGLGARHAAARAITQSTQAFSIVVSQSTQRISLFRCGRLVMALGQA